MPTSSPGPSPSPLVGVGLAAVSALLLGGGAVIWAHRDSPPSFGGTEGDLPRVVRWLPSPGASDGPAVVSPVAGLDLPEPATAASGLHSVAYGVEHGTRVVKIRVVPDGDELVIDAATGRLIETRPNRPTAPPPAGRFAAPFVPAT